MLSPFFVLFQQKYITNMYGLLFGLRWKWADVVICFSFIWIQERSMVLLLFDFWVKGKMISFCYVKRVEFLEWVANEKIRVAVKEKN